jgi:hypothetical protein
LRSDNAQGANAVAIDSATRISYVVDTLDIGKWLVFEITPKAVSGDSATGLPVRVVSSTPVSAWDVGIGEINRIDVMVYPNPVSDMIRIRTDRKVSRLVLFNSLPRPVIRLEQLNSDQITLGADDLPAGIYFLMVSDKVGRTGFCKIIRL